MYSLKSFNAIISNGALDSDKLPTTLRILNWGANETTDGTVYLNERTMDTFDFYQKKTGRDQDVPIDFDHASVPGSKEYVKGKPKVFAAYGNPRLVKGDGLYLDNLDWTPDGEKYARNYKDLSPTAMVDKDGTVLGLDSVALTPTGAVNNLTFYSAKTFEDVITMSNENLKSEYNKWPGNEGIKALSEKDTPDIEHDEDNKDCMCAKCMTAFSKKMSAADKISKSTKIVDADEPTKKTMSASPDDRVAMPQSFNGQPDYNKTMSELNSFKKMAAEVGMDGETDQEKVLYAFLAKYEGVRSENSKLINRKDNTEEGGLKQFSADMNSLRKEIAELKTSREIETKQLGEMKRQNLINKAAKEGKLIPLSADEVNVIDISILESLVANQKSGTIPTKRMMTADAKAVVSPAERINSFRENMGINKFKSV